MPGTIIVRAWHDHVDLVAVERNSAAMWALEFVAWVAEFGFNDHAKALFNLYRDALQWAEHYKRRPITV